MAKEEKDKLEIIKERFNNEKMNGDLSEAARRAKFSSPNGSTGLARRNWSECTKAEKKTLMQLLRILDERKQEESLIKAN